MSGYTLVSYNWSEFNKEIVLTKTPSNFMKFFGSKETTHKFIGNGTVWHEDIDGFLHRCCQFEEFMLCDFYMSINRIESQKPKN